MVQKQKTSMTHKWHEIQHNRIQYTTTNQHQYQRHHSNAHTHDRRVLLTGQPVRNIKILQQQQQLPLSLLLLLLLLLLQPRVHFIIITMYTSMTDVYC